MTNPDLALSYLRSVGHHSEAYSIEILYDLERHLRDHLGLSPSASLTLDGSATRLGRGKSRPFAFFIHGGRRRYEVKCTPAAESNPYLRYRELTKEQMGIDQSTWGLLAAVDLSRPSAARALWVILDHQEPTSPQRHRWASHLADLLPAYTYTVTEVTP